MAKGRYFRLGVGLIAVGVTRALAQFDLEL